MAEIQTALADQIVNFRFGACDQGFEERHVHDQGGDETCVLVENDDHTLSIRSPNGQQWLSIQPDGSRQGRPASGAPGPWEKVTLDGQTLTELARTDAQPADRPLVQFVVTAPLVTSSGSVTKRVGPVIANGRGFQDGGEA